MIGYFIVMVVAVSTIAGLGAYVAQSTNLAHRRNDMIAAIQYAEGGAVTACKDLDGTLTTTKTGGNMNSRLANKGYAQNNSVSTSSDTVYERTISSPFTNQTVTAQIWLPNVSVPKTARIVATAIKGKVTQTATVNVRMTWGYPAAIISTNPGIKTSSTGKDNNSGNVAVNGGNNGPIIVDANTGEAILANGWVNMDPDASVDRTAVSATNYNTANEIPDYTFQGTRNTLFDFPRFIAVADLTTNKYNPVGNNHFTNLATFLTANNRAWTNVNTANRALEGVIVVDIKKAEMKNQITVDLAPNGINVRGTLFFNFASDVGPTDKIFNLATMNINAADLSGLVATNSATYASGYPPVYFDNANKNPTNIDIHSFNNKFANVTPEEDLPALLYSIGILDMHGNANVCGVMYTPSFCEIENKKSDQIQYFKGSIITGLGIYFENNNASTSIVSYDAKTLDYLATLNGAGKRVMVSYWQ